MRQCVADRPRIQDEKANASQVNYHFHFPIMRFKVELEILDVGKGSLGKCGAAVNAWKHVSQISLYFHRKLLLAYISVSQYIEKTFHSVSICKMTSSRLTCFENGTQFGQQRSTTNNFSTQQQ